MRRVKNKVIYVENYRAIPAMHLLHQFAHVLIVGCSMEDDEAPLLCLLYKASITQPAKCAIDASHAQLLTGVTTGVAPTGVGQATKD
jgi:hypothetical protein